MAANRCKVFKIFIPTKILYSGPGIKVWENLIRLAYRTGVLLVLKWQMINVISSFNIKQNLKFSFHAAEAYSESFSMSKAECFVKKISAVNLWNRFQQLISLAKSSSSDVLQGSHYTSFQLTINISKAYYGKDETGELWGKVNVMCI